MFIMSVDKVLTSEVFWVFGTTLVTTFIGILAKILSRSPKQKSRTSLNEWNVGVDLIAGAMIILSARSINQFETSGEYMLVMLMLVVFLLGACVVVRLYGWKNKNDLIVFTGIVIPNIVGLIALAIVFKEFY